MNEVNLFFSQLSGIMFILVLLLLGAVFVLAYKVHRLGKEQLKRTREASDRMTDIARRFPDRQEQYAYNENQTARILQGTDNQTQQMMSILQHLDSRMDRSLRTQEERLDRVQKELGDKLSENDRRMQEIRTALSTGVTQMQQENSKKLDEMRQTVDEKLHATLDRRLTESFSLVNERLEQVYKGLGEMQSLAGNVTDLKRVLTNVKTRGIWGEMQLGALLSQILSPSQYEENCEVVPGTGQRVEFAVRLPGKKEEEPVYLPIDSKFPLENYQRLLSEQESGGQEQINAALLQLQNAIRTEGKRINKYISPPNTTDFAIMFLPVEGLYAETLRCRGLAEELQEKYRVVVAGPTTLSALLNSLQIGFRTLAVEQRTGEVWQLLGVVKKEFSRFTDLLETAQRQVSSVSNSLEQAAKKSKTITRKLTHVENLDGFSSNHQEEINLLFPTEEAGEE